MYWLEHRANLFFSLTRLQFLRHLEAGVENTGE